MMHFRLQDIWVWSGRPIWDDIFQVAIYSSCFCAGAAVQRSITLYCQIYLLGRVYVGDLCDSF